MKEFLIDFDKLTYILRRECINSNTLVDKLHYYCNEYIEFDDGENLPYTDEETIKNWVLGNSKVPDWVAYHFTDILNCRIDDIFIETNEE